MTENEIAKIIVHQSFLIHKRFGPGLLESAYKNCLKINLMNEGLKVESEKPIPLVYNGIEIGCGYRADLVIENRVIVETKCVESIADIHIAQILTYLRLSGNRLGLIINFNELLIKNGIKRVIQDEPKV